MAKRKKSNNLPLIMAGLVALFSVVSIVMLFVPFIAIKDLETTYTGLQIAFGYSEGGSLGGIFNASVTIFEFSFLNFLPYVLVIFGLILFLVGGLGKRNNLCILISIILFIGASVLFFLSPSFVDYFNSGVDGSELFELAIGAIIAGICAGLSAVCSLFRLAVK